MTNRKLENTESFVIYVLYYGQSEDGRGSPSFFKATQDKAEAKSFLKLHEKSPYCFCHVTVITPNTSKNVYKSINLK